MRTIAGLKRSINALVSRHYNLMEQPNYWGDKELRAKDMVICVKASDLRLELAELIGRKKEQDESRNSPDKDR